MTGRKNPEADIQRQIVRCLQVGLAAGSIVHHSANEVRRGGMAGKRQQAILKGMGVHAGHSDLTVYAPDGRLLFLEVKAPGETQTSAQRKFEASALRMGHSYAVVRSMDDAMRAVVAAGFPHLFARSVIARL